MRLPSVHLLSPHVSLICSQYAQWVNLLKLRLFGKEWFACAIFTGGDLKLLFMEAKSNRGSDVPQSLDFLRRCLAKCSYTTFDTLLCNIKSTSSTINSRSCSVSVYALVYDVKLLLGSRCSCLFSKYISSSLVVSMCRSRAVLGYSKFSYIVL